MPEKGPQPQPEKSETRQHTWPVAKMGDVLRTTPQPAADALLGEGHVLHLGAEGQIALELYPQAGVVRLWAQDTFVELTAQDGPHLRNRGVIFTAHASPDTRSGEMRRLIVTDQGDALLSLTPTLASEALQRPETNRHPADRVFPQSVGETPVSDHPAAPQMPPKTPSAHPQDKVQGKEMPPRLRLAGRVGKAPVMRTTRNGVLIARFPLAVHEEDGSTSWHQIVAFSEKAEKARDSLAKGQVVEVIGYLHEREQKTQGGKTKRVQELYAAVIKPR